MLKTRALFFSSETRMLSLICLTLEFSGAVQRVRWNDWLAGVIAYDKAVASFAH